MAQAEILKILPMPRFWRSRAQPVPRTNIKRSCMQDNKPQSAPSGKTTSFGFKEVPESEKADDVKKVFDPLPRNMT